MDNIERDIKILRKLLWSKLFLNKFPIISRVFVNKNGENIDIILSVKIIKDTKEYFAVRDEIVSYIWTFSKASSVEKKFNIYP
jgi:hypothetical protein